MDKKVTEIRVVADENESSVEGLKQLLNDKLYLFSKTFRKQ